MATEREKQLAITILKEKIEHMTGKKVVLKEYGRENEKRHNVIYSGFPEEFCIVFIPTANSVMADVVYKTNMGSYILLSKGGLRWDEIYGFYADEQEAKTVGEELLRKVASGEMQPRTI